MNKKGWLVMSKQGQWIWFPKKPKLDKEGHWYISQSLSDVFGQYPATYVDIDEVADDFTKSARPCEYKSWEK